MVLLVWGGGCQSLEEMGVREAMRGVSLQVVPIIRTSNLTEGLSRGGI